MFAFAVWRDYERVRDEVRVEVTRDRDLMYQHALTIFQTHEVIARNVINRVRGMSWDEVRQSRPLHEELAQMARQFPQVHSIWINDAKGKAHASSLMFPVAEFSAAHREYFKLLKTTDLQVVVARPFMAASGPPDEVFNISFRMTNPNGSFAGFVGTAISTSYFKEHFTSLNSGDETGSASSLYREDGAILVRVPPLPNGGTSYASDSAVLEQVRKTRSGEMERNSTLDGVWRSYAYAQVENFPVFVGRGMSQATVDARWRRNLVSYFAFFITSMAVLFALGFYAWRQHRAVVANAAGLEALVAERTRHLNRALDEKTAYFREVHHRVKNNLQIISSLARLQERHAEKQGTLERRIQAMALVHELLYSRAEATNLNLADYVPRLCSALQSTAAIGARCDVSAEPVAIDLERAIPFALILSEAVTNAFKHARSEGKPVEVKVGLRRDGGDLELTVADNGPGVAPEAAEGQGFGLKLIRALSVQLEGVSTFTQEDGVNTFTLRFPAEPPPHRKPAGA